MIYVNGKIIKTNVFSINKDIFSVFIDNHLKQFKICYSFKYYTFAIYIHFTGRRARSRCIAKCVYPGIGRCEMSRMVPHGCANVIKHPFQRSNGIKLNIYIQ